METTALDSRYVPKRLCVSGIFADEIISNLPTGIFCAFTKAEQL